MEYPVSEDTVVLLSEMAGSRLALDRLLQNWLSLSADWTHWSNEVCARYDRTTTRQHKIMAEQATILVSISTIHNHLISSCSHPGYAPPYFHLGQLPTSLVASTIHPFAFSVSPRPSDGPMSMEPKSFLLCQGNILA
jgi:hypothetical protein